MGMNQSDQCLFCKIANGNINSKKVYESEKVLAFHDIHPQAPLHLLFIHKNHSHNVNDLMVNHPNDLVDIFNAINEYTQSQKIDQNGFRIINNCGEAGGQTVFHTHFHLLAGKKLPW